VRIRGVAGTAGVWGAVSLLGCGSADQSASQGSPRPLVSDVDEGPHLSVRQLQTPRALDAPPPSRLARNPFRFGGPTRSVGVTITPAAPTLPPADGLPLLPLPLPQPPLRLLGVVTLTSGAKLAVISVGSEVLLAQTGETLVSRFRVGRIGEDAVELTDAVGERPMRLALP
jgi:hypothetical protein